MQIFVDFFICFFADWSYQSKFACDLWRFGLNTLKSNLIVLPPLSCSDQRPTDLKPSITKGILYQEIYCLLWTAYI